MAITHSTVAVAADEVGAEINKAEWNAAHVVSDGSFTIAKTTGLQTALDGKAAISSSFGEFTITQNTSGTSFYFSDVITGTLLNTRSDFDDLVTDIKTKIGTGLAPAYTYVKLRFGTGVYEVNTPIDWNRGNISIEGAGMGQTIFKLASSESATTDIIMTISPTQSASWKTLATAVSAGAQSIVLSTDVTSTYTDGKYFIINEKTRADTENSNRWKGEICRVKSSSYSAPNTTVVVAVTTGGGGRDGWGGSVLDSYATTGTFDGTATQTSILTMYENVSISECSFVDGATSRTGSPTAMSQGDTSWRFINNLTFRNVMFSNVFYSAIQLYQCLNVKISGCHFNNVISPTDTTAWYGVEIRGCTQNTTVTGCTFNMNRHGITQGAGGGTYPTTLSGVTRAITISGNTFINSPIAHIDVHQGADGVVFIGNTCMGDDGATSTNGIQVRSPATIIGNTIKSVTGTGISCDGISGVGANKVLIAHNTIDGCTAGIIVQGGVSKVAITGNHLVGIKTGYPIQLYAASGVTSGSNSIIANNYIADQTTDIASIYINSSSNVLVTGNLLYTTVSTIAIQLHNTVASPTNIGIIGNSISGYTDTNPIKFHASPSNTNIVSDNMGYNFGGSSKPTGDCFVGTNIVLEGTGAAVSGTTYTNRYCRKKLTLTSGTTVTVTINGILQATYASGMAYVLEINDTIVITGSPMPSIAITFV